MLLEFRRRVETEEATFQLRELLRGNKYRGMPSGLEGFVVEDLDLVLRWYGPNFGLDAEGRVRWIEMKHGLFTGLDPAKVRTFKPMVQTLQRYERFDGFFLVRSSDNAHDPSTSYKVNGSVMSADTFLDWCLTPVSEIPGLWV